MVLLDFDAHFCHGRQHFAAHILCGVLRRHREVTLLGADVMAEIAALVFGIGIGREFDRVKLETRSCTARRNI